MSKSNYDPVALEEINKRMLAALSCFDTLCPEAIEAAKNVLDGAFEDGLLISKPVWDGTNVTAVVREDIKEVEINCIVSKNGGSTKC